MLPCPFISPHYVCVSPLPHGKHFSLCVIEPPRGSYGKGPHCKSWPKNPGACVWKKTAIKQATWGIWHVLHRNAVDVFSSGQRPHVLEQRHSLLGAVGLVNKIKGVCRTWKEGVCGWEKHIKPTQVCFGRLAKHQVISLFGELWADMDIVEESYINIRRETLPNRVEALSFSAGTCKQQKG